MASRERTEELLTGFLDGNLSNEEAREIQRELLGNEQLRSELEQLRDLSRDLKALPQKRLGSDFASRVIAEAQRQALKSGLPEDHHVRLAEHAEITAATAPRKIGGPWIRWAAGSAAIAASLFVVFWLSGSGGSNVNNLLQNPSEGLVVVEPESDSQLPKLPDDLPPSDAFVKDPVDDSSSQFVRNQTQKTRAYATILTIDVFPSAKAWENNTVAEILKFSEIPVAAPIVVDSKIVSALHNTKVITDEGEGTSEVALIFVEGPGKKVDGVFLDIAGRKQEFGKPLLNMIVDRPDQQVAMQLQQAIGTLGSLQGQATPIVSKGGALNFNSDTKEPAQEENAAPLNVSMFGNQERVGLLLIIHKPK